MSNYAACHIHHVAKKLLTRISIHLLAFCQEFSYLIGYATHYLFFDRQ